MIVFVGWLVRGPLKEISHKAVFKEVSLKAVFKETSFKAVALFKVFNCSSSTVQGIEK